MKYYSRNLLMIILAIVLVIIVFLMFSSNIDIKQYYKIPGPDLNSEARPTTHTGDSPQTNHTEEYEPIIYETNTGDPTTFATNNINDIEKNSQKYRIDTAGCRISELPLFDEETRDLFEDYPETVWRCKPSQMHITRFNETWVSFDWYPLPYKPLCYYRSLGLNPKGDKRYFLYGQFSGPITNKVINFPDYEFVHILCFNNRLKVEDRKVTKNFNANNSDIIHNEIIPLIPVVNKTSDSDAPNVLLLAIDATSYVNFKRHFLRTGKLVNKHGFFELKGYNKVGANTFPNMIPFLTGHHSKELVPDSELKHIFFDDWPMVWKEYSRKGFVTTFLEEMSWCGLFHFNLWGFKKKPTDYQLRPFHMEIMQQKYRDYCYTDRTEMKMSLDWTYDFIRAMNKRRQKYFAYISISEMTHDWIEAGHFMDVDYQLLFMKLFEEDLLNNTLVLFFSDHGFRYGDLRHTHTGEMENRLPFMFIHLPQNFSKQYEQNLRQNQHRLTTAFDIHATLTHVIRGEANGSLPHGQSLFESVISPERDCSDASIPEMYCGCYEDIEIEEFDVIKPDDTVPKIMAKIRSYTQSIRDKCAEYEFDSIHKLFLRDMTRNDSEFKLGDSLIFIIQLFVNPGMALFETVLRGFDENRRFIVINEITRINLYGNQSHCLNDKILNNYCFCNDLLQK